MSFLSWLQRNLFNQTSRAQRERFIKEYEFPLGLRSRFAQAHSALDEAACAQVFEALKTYFWICGRSRGMASMPSQIVDDAWHEFILFTREYSNFCDGAFGYFLHHTPAQAMKSPTEAQEGIKRTWKLACFHDGIDPRNPGRLPLLFALDAQLQIPDGFSYSLDCLARPQNRDDFCATHIGCGSSCGNGSSDNSSEGDSGDSSSGDGGGGDSGGGCGGGCGGGGD